MAHVHTFGKVAPAAAGIIHLGATSCYVTECVLTLLSLPIQYIDRGASPTQQCRSHFLAHRPWISHTLTRRPHLAPLCFRRRIQRPAHSWVYSLPTCTAIDGRKAGYLVAAGRYSDRPGTEIQRLTLLANRNYFGIYGISNVRETILASEVSRAQRGRRPAFWLFLMATIIKLKSWMR